jgi:hypothetical protein
MEKQPATTARRITAAAEVNGKPLAGVVGVTFYLYKDQEGGAPLWLETQNVQGLALLGLQHAE